ncbi:glucosidase II beta subunit-like protein-domain-containing protein [Haematococcus lacustris]
MRFVDVLAETGHQLCQYWQDSVGTGGGLKEARRRQQERMLKGMRERDEKVKQEMAGHLESLRAPWSVDNPPGWGQEDQVEAGQESGAAGLAAAAARAGGAAAGQGVAGVADAQAVATEAGQALEAAQALLAELQQQAQLVKRYHLQAAAGGDFGPQDVFLPLAGRCLEDAGRWHYEACFFDSASQSEAGGLNKVSLGTWSGFSQDYQQAYFTGGDPCEGGPARSLTLQLVCGAQEQLWGGEEPSPCTYTAWMSTPAACREQDREQEQARLQQLERVEEEVRAECGAAEGSEAHDEL